MAKKIGVLALQGDFIEHLTMLNKLGAETIEVRLPEHLINLDGLIVPGGESTTISRLIHEWNLYKPILKHAAQGMGIWGTCAGAILLAELGLMDITVVRNAFGRQIDSFVTELNFPAIGAKPFTAVFIRAPIITKVGPKAKALIKLDNGTIVAAEQNKLLATSFHPELTDDTRFHEYFLHLISNSLFSR
jgi:5'-phosphate synthase pdxT subunit